MEEECILRKRCQHKKIDLVRLNRVNNQVNIKIYAQNIRCLLFIALEMSFVYRLRETSYCNHLVFCLDEMSVIYISASCMTLLMRMARINMIIIRNHTKQSVSYPKVF